MEKKCTNCAVEVGGERGRFLERCFADLIQMVLGDQGKKIKGRIIDTFAVSCCVVSAYFCRAPKRASLRNVPALFVTTLSPIWKRVTPGPVLTTLPAKHTALQSASHFCAQTYFGATTNSQLLWGMSTGMEGHHPVFCIRLVEQRQLRSGEAIFLTLWRGSHVLYIAYLDEELILPRFRDRCRAEL
jgi:hypothetical protein